MRKYKKIGVKLGIVPVLFFIVFVELGTVPILHNFTYSYDSGYIGGNTCKLYTDKEIFSAIKDIIKEAKYKIHLNIYEFQDFDIADSLIEKSKKGVDVKIILDRKAKGNSVIKKYLSTNRINVVYYPTYEKYEINHTKLIIADKKVVIGGANLGINSPNNHDIAILVEGPAVSEFDRIFYEDWQKSTVKKRDSIFLKQKYPLDKESIDTLKILTDYDIRKELLRLIRHSKLSIYIEMFVLSDFEVINALIEAKAKGVDVAIILDPNQPNNYDSEKMLEKGNIQIKWYPVEESQKMHMKLSVFDKEKALFGSANLSYSGLKINHEIDVLTNNKIIVGELTKNFESDLQKSLVDSPVDKNSIKKFKKRK